MDGILVLVVMALVVAVAFVVIRSGTRRLLGERRRLEEQLGLEALQARFQRGDITLDEFDRARRALTP